MMKLVSLALAAVLHGLGVVTARPDTVNFQPEEISSIDGILELTLNVGLVTTEYNRTAPGYNGGAVGPTLRAKPGDKVRITLNNNLEPSTSEEVELNSFVLTPPDETMALNQTMVVNRLLLPKGNIWSLGRENYWGKSFQNLHFHGIMVDPTIDDSRVYIDGGETKVYEFDIPEDSPPLSFFT